MTSGQLVKTITYYPTLGRLKVIFQRFFTIQFCPNACVRTVEYSRIVQVHTEATFVVGDVFVAVSSVQVFVSRDAPTSGTALVGNIHAPPEEQLPHPEQAVAIMLVDVLLVAKPVVIPTMDSVGIMDADVFDMCHLKIGVL